MIMKYFSVGFQFSLGISGNEQVDKAARSTLCMVPEKTFGNSS